MRRVVVTGMGAVTPIGNNIDEYLSALMEGKCGISEITLFDTAGYEARLGAEVKGLKVEDYIDKKEARRMDRFCVFGMVAAIQAMNDANIKEGDYDPYRFSVIVGSGVGGVGTVEDESLKFAEKGPSRVSPFYVPMIISNILPGQIAIKYNCKGSVLAVVTACTSGTNAIGEAYRQIKSGYADAAVCGGSEAGITKAGVAGFINMKALTTSKDPSRASIPFDAERSGFVIGEGSAMLVLEELESAKRRGAKIYAEIVGYGSTCDAHHITAPDPEAQGAANAMAQAIKEANIAPSQVSYINAHGTSTPLNDLCETKAIKMVFGEYAKKVPVSSTKSMTGHLLGAAGAIEAVASILAINHSFIPPTINYKVPDPELDLDYVPNAMRKHEVKYALSNSFGFGGHNGSLLFKKWE
ncbi:MAG: beta-ketoacyl-ACP synthase II [Clostridiaceae bacterium]|mgnify:FL=1|nr:beta-ketoacyl-ACP synthase II [Clostridiaceae bacterium]